MICTSVSSSKLLAFCYCNHGCSRCMNSTSRVSRRYKQNPPEKIQQDMLQAYGDVMQSNLGRIHKKPPGLPEKTKNDNVAYSLTHLRHVESLSDLSNTSRCLSVPHQQPYCHSFCVHSVWSSQFAIVLSSNAATPSKLFFVYTDFLRLGTILCTNHLLCKDISIQCLYSCLTSLWLKHID